MSEKGGRAPRVRIHEGYLQAHWSFTCQSVTRSRKWNWLWFFLLQQQYLIAWKGIYKFLGFSECKTQWRCCRIKIATATQSFLIIRGRNQMKMEEFCLFLNRQIWKMWTLLVMYITKWESLNKLGFRRPSAAKAGSLVGDQSGRINSLHSVPNSLPPPLPTIRASCTTFLDVKNDV